MSDGVEILSPKTKPKHFTQSQIKKTITEVLRDATHERYAGAVGNKG